MDRRHTQPGRRRQGGAAPATDGYGHLDVRRLRALLRGRRRALSPHPGSADRQVGAQSPLRHDPRGYCDPHRCIDQERIHHGARRMASRSSIRSPMSMRSRSIRSERSTTPKVLLRHREQTIRSISDRHRGARRRLRRHRHESPLRIQGSHCRCRRRHGRGSRRARRAVAGVLEPAARGHAEIRRADAARRQRRRRRHPVAAGPGAARTRRPRTPGRAAR
jgi:hypothetical protein